MKTQPKVTEFHSEPGQDDLLKALRKYYADDNGEILGDIYHCEISRETFRFFVERDDIGTTEPYFVWNLYVAS